jgi:hypothetical protein
VLPVSTDALFLAQSFTAADDHRRAPAAEPAARP